MSYTLQVRFSALRRLCMIAERSGLMCFRSELFLKLMSGFESLSMSSPAIGNGSSGEGLKGAQGGLGDPITEEPPSQLALGPHPPAACC